MLRLTALLLAMVAFHASARPGDPLRSPECAVARDVLERALDDASARRPGARERLAQVRKEAIEACLGREGGDAVRTGAPDPPIVVPAPVIALPRTPVAPSASEASQPLVIPRAVTITTCDPGGCWDSEGRRLNQFGPVFVGPSGVCSVQAGKVHCP